MGYRAQGATETEMLVAIDQRTQEIAKRQEDDARSRRIAVYIAAASALFAAVKLGLIAIPHFRRLSKKR